MSNKSDEAIPNDINAELSVLGSILIDPDSMIKVADILTSDDFFDEKNGYIYKAMNYLYSSHKAIDTLTVSDRLRKEGLLEIVGGLTTLTNLTNYVPSASHIEQYAEIVSEKSIRRNLINTSRAITESSKDETRNIQDLVDSAETELFKVSQKQIKQEVSNIASILSSSFDRLDELSKDKSKTRGVPTGFRDLDKILAGLQPSDLFILAARPSMGKTALSLNLAHNIATKAKLPVLLFSLEMSKEQLVDRMLAAESGVDSWNIRTGNLSDTDFEKISYAMGTLSEATILIDDTASLSINEMRTKAKREAHKTNLGVIIVDYLQLMSGGPRFRSDSNRVQEISEISRGLKGIARELHVPVIALSQLSRSVESRSPQIPQLADLRESGSIEQDADVVAFIYREEYYNPETENKNITKILVKKHRNGPTGNIDLYFDKEKQRFRSLDTQHSQPFDY